MKVGCLCVAHFQHGYLCVLLIMQSKVIVDRHNKFKTSHVFTLFLSSACTLEAYTDRQTDRQWTDTGNRYADRQTGSHSYLSS